MDTERIAARLRTHGYVEVVDSLPAKLLAGLGKRCDASGEMNFVPASVGRDADRTQLHSVRGDVISWLDDSNAAEHSFLGLMDELRQSLNRQLYLGLFDYECHYAIYARGACYARHLDALRGEKNRILSTVVYLNEEWRSCDGGELVLYNGGNQTELARILPAPGLMVVFLSEEFPHEVLSAKKQRHSIAGWFRGRTAS